jgi:hypothetical protein
MKIKQKREAGKLLGREGLALRVQEIIQSAIDNPSYKGAMACAGQMAELADAASYDDYWNEQVYKGRNKEQYHLLLTIETKETIK